MKKYTLSTKGVTTTEYDTKEFFVEQRRGKTVSTKRKDIFLMKGSNRIVIDSDVVLDKEELKTFTKENFTNPEIAFKRISSAICPQTYKAIF